MTAEAELFEKITKDMLEVFKKKNADYGNSFMMHGVIGVLVRMQDKINRFMNITKTNRQDQIIMVKDEALSDTLLDLANYAVIAKMILDADRAWAPSIIPPPGPYLPQVGKNSSLPPIAKPVPPKATLLDVIKAIGPPGGKSQEDEKEEDDGVPEFEPWES